MQSSSSRARTCTIRFIRVNDVAVPPSLLWAPCDSSSYPIGCYNFRTCLVNILLRYLERRGTGLMKTATYVKNKGELCDITDNWTVIICNGRWSMRCCLGRSFKLLQSLSEFYREVRFLTLPGLELRFLCRPVRSQSLYRCFQWLLSICYNFLMAINRNPKQNPSILSL
jgi:hypothetical protein